MNIVGAKMLRVTPELSKQHYAEHVAKPFYKSLEDFITSAPIMALAIEGLDAIRVIREMLGRDQRTQSSSGYHSWRLLQFATDEPVHASDSPESAARELALYFQPQEICEHELRLTPFLRASDE